MIIISSFELLSLGHIQHPHLLCGIPSPVDLDHSYCSGTYGIPVCSENQFEPTTTTTTTHNTMPKTRWPDIVFHVDDSSNEDEEEGFAKEIAAISDSESNPEVDGMEMSLKPKGHSILGSVSHCVSQHNCCKLPGPGS